MKILYLCQRIPFPPDRGDRIVTYNQIRHLARHHEVTEACRMHVDETEAAKKLTTELDIKLIACNHSGLRKIRGMTLCLMTGRPLTLGYFDSRKLHTIIPALLRNNHHDAVIVFSSSMAQYTDGTRHITRIMNFCDIDSQKWRELAKHRKGFLRWIYERESRLLLEYERRVAASYTASCVVTSHEAELFRTIIPGVPVYVLENGVDVDYFAAFPRQPVGIVVLFVGVMDYAPNAEAVAYFAKQVWPSIVAAYPEARFRVVGSRPTRAVKKLAEIRGVEITGYVPDIRPYLSSATLLVAPLAIARGVQNKVLEAMASGLPVLTTPYVAAGLPSGAKSTVFVEDRDSKRFASAVLRLIENHEMREQKGASALDFIRRHCTWELKLQALDELLQKVAAPSSNGRHQ